MMAGATLSNRTGGAWISQHDRAEARLLRQLEALLDGEQDDFQTESDSDGESEPFIPEPPAPETPPAETVPVVACVHKGCELLKRCELAVNCNDHADNEATGAWSTQTCKHPGCVQLRSKSRSLYCQDHRLRTRSVVQVKGGAPPRPCKYPGCAAWRRNPQSSYCANHITSPTRSSTTKICAFENCTVRVRLAENKPYCAAHMLSSLPEVVLVKIVRKPRSAVVCKPCTFLATLRAPGLPFSQRPFVSDTVGAGDARTRAAPSRRTNSSAWRMAVAGGASTRDATSRRKEDPRCSVTRTAEGPLAWKMGAPSPRRDPPGIALHMAVADPDIRKFFQGTMISSVVFKLGADEMTFLLPACKVQP
eukprot:CAMPEP_0114246786 /NCGR_PEP_ID=MMETSP0058-20121206/12664_1 /TAXON_ID=36894 /ORGANISM="Pyramimonas parkeae, CCMP726" /LENGTH=362 /DNA_ID=CAMNT_0001360027 /DNA_START=250 /DNA_END=1339 /DNA_ORIENTATION=-